MSGICREFKPSLCLSSKINYGSTLRILNCTLIAPKDLPLNTWPKNGFKFVHLTSAVERKKALTEFSHFLVNRTQIFLGFGVDLRARDGGWIRTDTAPDLVLFVLQVLADVFDR